MKIKKVEIEGFRAYKLKRDGTFDFTVDGENPSNFIAIYAPNGFGKSSFYDAVEWAFTNNLERYVRDQSRKNNELAAKGTKVSGTPQYILRNKDAGPEISTSVNVVTTGKNFFRDLGTVRHDSRDLRFNEADTEEGSEVFRRIILSQDAIDRFLREVKPQERYNLFMEYFGGEVERLRQEITAIRSDNRNVLDALRQERTSLNVQLQEPVDNSVFAAFNAVAAFLNSKGESVALVSPDFSTKVEHEILASIVTRVHELNSLQESQLVTKTTLVDKLDRLPDIVGMLNNINEERPKLTLLITGVDDSRLYEKLLSALIKHSNDLQSENESVEFLRNVEMQIPSYTSALQQLRMCGDRQSTLNLKKTDVVAQLAKNESFVKLHSDQLLNADKTEGELKTLLSTSGTLYKEISAAQARLIALEGYVSAKLAALGIEIVDRDAAKNELNKISSIDVTLPSLLSSDISILNLEKQELDEVEQISYQLNSIKIQEDNILRVQESLTKQMGLIENLVLLGVDYVNTWPTDTCPLCHSSHASEKELRSVIEGNAVISSIVSDNAKVIKEFNLLKEKLELRLNQILIDIRNKKASRGADLQTKLTNISERISLLERERDVANSQIISIQQQISVLKSKVYNLSQDDLVLKLTSELNKLSETKHSYFDQLTGIKSSMEFLKLQLSEIEADLSQVISIKKSIFEQSYYKEITEFAVKNAIAPEEIETALKDKLRISLNNKNILIEQRDKVLTDKQVLQEKMSSDGNWVDFGLLTALKDRTEQIISSSEKTIQIFFDEVGKILPGVVEGDVEAIHMAFISEIERIEGSLVALDERISNFTLLQNQLDAFKPYIKSLALRETLYGVEKNLIKHIQVDEKLGAELDVIFANLKDRISAFFYTDLINSIYSKIDPHPSFKEVKFVPDFSISDRPGLNIVISDENGETISPNLYFSAAQLNILSLSVFLARALHAKDADDKALDVILIDDPIQSMDSINVLATIDLLRNISLKFNKQIILSTHDENFFGLLQRKIPTEIFNSKFLTLESFGVVAPVKWQPSRAANLSVASVPPETRE